MAIKTRDEIMTQLQTIIGDDTSDETLAFIQDVSDTIGDNSSADRIAELERQVEETDATWRKKYRDTFFGGSPDSELDEPDEPKKPRTYAELFTVSNK